MKFTVLSICLVPVRRTVGEGARNFQRRAHGQEDFGQSAGERSEEVYGFLPQAEFYIQPPIH